MAKNRGNPVSIQEQQQVEAPSSQLVLPYQFTAVSKLSTLPNAKNITRIKFQNIAPVTITDFKNGQEGQELILMGDGFTTLQNGTNIFTNTALDKLLLANYIYKIIKFDGAWREL